MSKVQARNAKAIALRITDVTMQERVEKIASENGLSLNLAVNMLLGYAFNQIDATGKQFAPKVIFELVDKEDVI